jgi:hypothetical protein
MEEAPKHKVDCGVAAYLMDASAELATLNAKFKILKGLVHRGEPDMFLNSILDIRSTTRKFLRALEMTEHCIQASRGETP